MRFLFTILTFIISFNIFSQNRAIISGAITNSEGTPIEIAHIKLKNSTIGTLSDFKGKYSISVPGIDSCYITVSCLGYKKVTRLLLKPQGNITLNFQLYTESEALEEVEVIANRVNINNVEKIDYNKNNLIPSAGGKSIESMLSTFAGVNSNNELSSQYSVRGGSYDENIVYINGTEIYRPLLVRGGQQEGLSIINPDMVSSVNFSSGGYGAEYGDKMASVLDIEYKKPNEFEASVGMSLLGANASIGQRSKKFSQLHGIRYKQNNSLLNTLDTKGEYSPKFFDYQTFLTYDINNRFSVGLLGNISQNKYSFIPESRETSFGTLQDAKKFKVYFDGNEEDIFRTLFGSLSLNYKNERNFNLNSTFSAFVTDERETYDITGEYWLDNLSSDNNESQGSLGIGSYHQHARNSLTASVVSFALKGNNYSEKNKLQYGLNVQSERIDDKISEWEMRDSAGYSVPSLTDKVELIYSLHSSYKNSTTRMGAFLQDTYRFNLSSGRMIVTAGLRGSYWTFNKEFILSPRVTLAFIPEDLPLTTRFSSGIYYQTPFYKEYRDTITDQNGNLIVDINEKIKSQRSIHLVLGSDYNFKTGGRPFKFTTELYYKKLDNLIPYEVDNVRIRYYGKNLSKGNTMGIDFKLFGEFVPETDSWLSFSLMKSKETFWGKSVSRPNEQRYSFSLYFNDYVPGLIKYRMSLKAIFADGIPFGSPQYGRTGGVFRTSPYRRVDIGISREISSIYDGFMNRGLFKFIKNASVSLEVFNLLDIQNVNSYYWVNAVNGDQYAVPNYLTGRQINLSLNIDF
ncbi:MAG: TonB-dependent receptor [Bacteroidales bacterium]|nr:TonB-dependent receptor [Bacteroidales bacterium]